MLSDVACGTGMRIAYFQKYFSCTGVDLSQQMLEMARLRLKNVKLQKADMLDLNLGKTFDAITCLFGSISYAKTLPGLKKVIEGFYRHLKFGGILEIDSWYNKSQWKPGTVKIGIYDAKNTKLIRASYNDINGKIAIFNEHYLLAEKNKGIKHYSSSQEFGLFSRAEMIKVLKASNFNSITIKRIYKSHDRYIVVK